MKRHHLTQLSLSDSLQRPEEEQLSFHSPPETQTIPQDLKKNSMHLLWKATRQAAAPFSTTSTARGEALTKARFTQEEKSLNIWSRISAQPASKMSTSALEDDILYASDRTPANWKSPKPRDLKHICGTANEYVASCESTSAAVSCKSLGYCQASKFGGQS